MKRIIKHKGHIHLVIGASRLGSNVAKNHAKSGKYVTVIDKNPNAQFKLGDNYVGSFVLGDASKTSVLEEADIKHVIDVLICTDNDDTNIYLANLIYILYGIKKIIVRIDDEQKEKLLASQEFKVITPSVQEMSQYSKFDEEETK